MSKWNTGAQPKTRADWEEAGREAILDLLESRWVVPWAEAEARICGTGWDGFPRIQALQLHAARRTLIESEAILYESTRHTTPVVTVRLPAPAGKVKDMARLRGQRRKEYRRYLSWAVDYDLCGKIAEQVVMQTARMFQSEAGVWVPPQQDGDVTEVAGIRITGSFDGLAYILDTRTISRVASLVIEVKNINGWVYPWAKELWELLVRAARLAEETPVVPLFVCMRTAWQTWQMAQDIGFMQVQLTRQVFSPSIDRTAFATVISEFGLLASQAAAPDEHVASYLKSTLRRNPPVSPPAEDIEFWERSMLRFRELAPVILRFDALAGDLPDDARSRLFAAFKVAAGSAMLWTTVKGW
jgi:hypothetical protein